MLHFQVIQRYLPRPSKVNEFAFKSAAGKGETIKVLSLHLIDENRELLGSTIISVPLSCFWYRKSNRNYIAWPNTRHSIVSNTHFPFTALIFCFVKSPLNEIITQICRDHDIRGRGVWRKWMSGNEGKMKTNCMKGRDCGLKIRDWEREEKQKEMREDGEWREIKAGRCAESSLCLPTACHCLVWRLSEHQARRFVMKWWMIGRINTLKMEKSMTVPKSIRFIMFEETDLRKFLESEL